jgi:hypothetical protein
VAQVPLLTPAEVVKPTDRPGTARANDYFHLDTPQATPADFGADIARGAAVGGAGIENAGGEFGRAALAQAAIDNESAARDASTKAQQTMASLSSDYLSKQGQDAVNGFGAFQAGMKDAVDGAASTMTNPMARNMLLNQLSRMQGYYNEAGARHKANQTVEYAAGSHTAQSQTFADNAVTFRNDPGKVDEMINNGAQELAGLAQVRGWDPATLAEKQQQYRGQAYQKVIESIALDDPIRAKAMFDRSRQFMDGEAQLRVGEFLKAKVEGAGDKAWFNGQVYGGSIIPGTTAAGDTYERGIIPTESGGQQFGPDGQPLRGIPGDPDSPVGVAQVRPSTAAAGAAYLGVKLDLDKLNNDPVYNRMIGRAVFETLTAKYQNPTLATAAYYAGPGNVDQMLTKFGDPRTGQISFNDWLNKVATEAPKTAAYVRRISGGVVGSNSPDNAGAGAGISGQATGPGGSVGVGALGQPTMSRDDALQAALKSAPGDPETGLRRAGMVNRYYDIIEHGQAQQRGDLDRTVSDLGPRLLAGETATIPEVDIRKLYDQQRADQTIANLRLDQAAGTIFNSMKFATPFQIQALETDYLNGQGMFGDVFKGRKAREVGGVLVDNGQGPNGPSALEGDEETKAIREALTVVGGTPEQNQLSQIGLPGGGGPPPPVGGLTADFRTRNLVWERMKSLELQRAQSLDPKTGDPASYVMGMSNVGAAYKQAHGQNATADDFQNYAQSSLEAQKLLGVPDQNQRVLPKQEAIALAQRFISQDPTKTDNGPLMDTLAKAYGPYWNKVYGQMVTEGHLPANAETIGWLNGPGQDIVRGDFTKAMQLTAEKGGMAEFKKSAPPQVVSNIEKDIDAQLDPLRATLMPPGASIGGDRAWQNVRDSVMMTALYRSIHSGGDGTTELQKTVHDMIDAKWDFNGSYRVPKSPDGSSQLPNTELATMRAQMQLQPEQIQREAGNANLSDAEWQGIVKRSDFAWVNNTDGSGVYLVQKRQDGAWVPIHLQNGERDAQGYGPKLELSFADIAKQGPRTAQETNQTIGQAMPLPTSVTQ